MPPEGLVALSHRDILRYEELLRLIHLATRLGVKKIRLTGGEPLVRKGIVGFVRAVSGIAGIEDLSMTTNGSLLSDMAYPLKKAGLKRINISMDTANPERFAMITGRGQLTATLAGIEKALAVGLTPVKINVALTSYFKQEDLDYFTDLVHGYPIHVRFIEYMPLGACRITPGPTVKTLKSMLNLAGRGGLTAVTNEAVMGSGPAKYYKLPRAQGTFGFITPISEQFCYECNRLRLMADGKLKPCLLSNEEIDIKTPLRNGADDQRLMQLFRQAISEKPLHHSLCRISGELESKRHMSQIGG
jgi:cyclic pyranopterin phosphate synthase